MLPRMSLELILLVVGAVVVGGLVGLWWRSRGSGEPALELPPNLSPEEANAQLSELVASGNTINAIKLYRLLHGGSLKDAKDAVEAMRLGRQPPAPPARGASSADATDAIERAIRDDNLIQAIKLYRDQHGVGLKEAKDAVEAMRAALRRG
jgi:ribosomal protein L7/L12